MYRFFKERTYLLMTLKRENQSGGIEMKKLLAVFLILALLMGSASAALAQERETPEQIRERLRTEAREQYSENELAALNREMARIRSMNEGFEPLEPGQIVSQRVQFRFDTPLVIRHGRILVPVRALTAAYGAEVTWDEEDHTVTVELEDKVLVIDLDTGEATLNGEEVSLDVPPMLMNGRMVLPLRFVLEAMGFSVSYDRASGIVEIED